MNDTNTVEASSEITSIWNRNFICVFIAQACLVLGQGASNILIARYATEILGVSPVFMGNLVGLNLAVALAMRPVAGPLQTKLNKRNLLMFAYFTGGIVNLGYGLSSVASAFTFFRCIQGIQYAFQGPLTMVLAVNSLPKGKITSGVAMYGLGGTIGMAIAPNFGLFLRDLGPLLAEGPAGAALGYKIAFFFSGALMSMAVIPLAMYKYKKETKEEIASTGAWYKNIVSKHAIPIVVVLMMFSIANAGYRGFLDPLAVERGIKNIGLFSTTSALVMMSTRPFVVRLTERFGIKKIIPLAFSFTAVGLVIISQSNSLPMVLCGAFLTAVGNGFIMPGLQALCIQTETPLKRSVATNTLFAGQDLAGYVGPLLGGMVIGKFNYSTTVLSGLVPLCLMLLCFFLIMPGFTRRQNMLATLEKHN